LIKVKLPKFNGKVDGKWTYYFPEDIRQYQKENGLYNTGTVTVELLDHLKISR